MSESIVIDWDKLKANKLPSEFNHLVTCPKAIMKSTGIINKSRYNYIEPRLPMLRALERNIFRSEMKLMMKLIGEPQSSKYGRRTVDIKVKGEESCFQDNSPKPQLKLTVSLE